MDLSMRWLNDYVKADMPIKEFVADMTMSGSKVETYHKMSDPINNVVVAKVLKLERHPDSEKLWICQLDAGREEPVQIVTAAQNLFEGAIVPACMHNSTIADGTKITKGKLRGVASNGMMCSYAELGLTKDDFDYPVADDGILILNNDPDVDSFRMGMDICEALQTDDTIVEFEITNNRPDCLSVLGLAQEASATFDIPMNYTEPSFKGVDGDITKEISVSVENTKLCSRYMAALVKNVKIGPSPKWMARRLRASGVRPINNLVDITNFVMLEYGHPMHAFDLRYVEDNRIVVRNAKEGETLKLLDEMAEPVKLTPEMLIIADGKKPIAIAGVMGGEHSGIMEDTTTVVFEAACFDGTNIRLSGKKIGMRTDAQAKFEKGLDPNTTMEAMNRACQLIEELGAGEVVGGCVDVYPEKKEPIDVAYDVDKINALLGIDVSEDEMCKYWEMVDLVPDKAKKCVHVPTWRQDILRLADLAEEVARFYGYDKIPTTLPSGEATQGGVSYQTSICNMIRNVIESYGFSEGMTYSFESPKAFDKLLIPKGDELRKAIEISNPLGVDYSIMRTTPLNGMLTSLSTNYNHRNKDVRLYEMANVYLPESLPLTKLPEEKMMLALGMYGQGDFFDMKGCVEAILDRLGITTGVTYEPKGEHSYLHPGRKADIMMDREVLGYLGEVHPEVADNYNLGTKTYVAVLDVAKLAEKANFDIKYQGVAKFPAVTRDISLVMKKTVLAGQIEEVIRKSGGKLLEDYHLFDIYEGENVGKDEKSLAYSIRFRAKDRTLEDKDVTTVMDKILKKLESLGVSLRQ